MNLLKILDKDNAFQYNIKVKLKLEGGEKFDNC